MSVRLPGDLTEIEIDAVGRLGTLDVDGLVDEARDITYWGQATRQPDGTWRAVARVGSCVCVVEFNLQPITEVR